MTAIPQIEFTQVYGKLTGNAMNTSRLVYTIPYISIHLALSGNWVVSIRRLLLWCRPDDSGSTRASFCKRRHFGYKCGGPDRYISGRNDTQTVDFFTPGFTNEFILKKGAKKKHCWLYGLFKTSRVQILRRSFFTSILFLVRRPFQCWFQSPKPRHLKKHNLRDLERDVVIFHWFPWFLEKRWCGVIMNHSSNIQYIQCMKHDKKRDQPKTIILILWR